MVFSIAMGSFLIWLLRLSNTSEDDFAREERVINYSIIIFIIATVILLFGQAMANMSFLMSTLQSAGGVLLVIIIGLFAIVFWYSERINSTTIKDLKWADAQYQLLKNIMRDEYFSFGTSWKVNRDSFLQNKGIIGQDVSSLVYRCVNVTEYIFGNGYNGEWNLFMYKIIPVMDQKLLGIIEQEKESLREMRRGPNNWEAWYTIDQIIHLYLLGELKELGIIYHKATEERKKQERKQEKLQLVLAYPFRKIGQFCSWLWRPIGRFFLTLKDLWNLFNKLCPEVSKPKKLD
jgi:hypothetical protein